MTPPNARTKASEIILELGEFLSGRAVADGFTLQRLKRVATESMYADASEAYAALGMIAALQWNDAETDSNFLNAIRLDNEYTVHMNYGTSLQLLGRYADAAEQMRIGFELAPTDLSSLRAAIRINLAAGEIGAAEILCERLARLTPDRESEEIPLVSKVAQALEVNGFPLESIKKCHRVAVDLLRERKIWSSSLTSEVDTDDNIVFFILGLAGDKKDIEALDEELGARLFESVADFNPAKYWVGFGEAGQP